MGCAGVFPQPVIQRSIGSQVFVRGDDPVQQDGAEFGTLRQPYSQPYGFPHPAQVLGFLIVVVIQERLHVGVRGRKGQLPGAQS